MQTRPAINQVQPDYLDKMDFVPVEYASLTAQGQTPETLSTRLLAREPAFYTQTTMISKPTTTGFVGLTDYGPTSKVRFEVTENFLIARQAFQYVHGVDSATGTDGIGQNPFVGDVVAVYRISSHFDIRRQYNPTTGEELNVVTENSTDRPWYQRRYMRVDWSQNLVDAYGSVLRFQEWSGQVQSVPVPVYVNNPEDPNRPVFEYAGSGDQRTLQYFDVVNRAVLQPPTINFGPNAPAVPACRLAEGWDESGGLGAGVDCAPAEVGFRVSFRRVDPARDYEPASLSSPLPRSCATDADCGGATGACDVGSQQCIPSAAHYLDMDRFGTFDASRIGFDAVHAQTLDTQRMHFAARHNLWQWHHALVFGADGATACNADAECAGGQVCHIGNAPHDAQHRGLCAPLAIAHVDGDAARACQTDDDCHLGGDGTGLSNTAVCDAATGTCGEHFVRCSLDADCAAVDVNSRCDTTIAYNRNDNTGLCTMPYLQRQVRPVVYHETPNYPTGVQPVTESIAHEWNDAFSQGVTQARVRECQVLHAGHPLLGAPADDPSCDTDQVKGLDPALGQDARFVWVACHSPVLGTDPNLPGHTDPYDGHALTDADVAGWRARGWDLPACGAQGTVARIGDLRYNQIGGITDVDPSGLWGLANIAEDPESGEMVSARGAMWQTVTDLIAQYVVDLVRIENNDLPVDQVTDGSYLAEGLRQLGAGQTPAGAVALRGASPSDQVLDEPLRAPGALGRFDLSHTGLARLLPLGNAAPSGAQTMYSLSPDARPGLMQNAVAQLAHSGVLGDGSDTASARLASLAGTELEARLVDQHQAMLAPSSTFDSSGITPATVQAASPFRDQSPAVRHVMDRMRAQLSAWQCGFTSDFSDDMILGLAQRLTHGAPIDPNDPDDAPVAFGGVQDAFGRPTGMPWNFQNGDGTANYTAMVQYLRQLVSHGVLAHELGHSLGQRHNFTASADALNYDDHYWRARGLGHQAHTVAGVSDHGIRPRYEYLNDPAEHNSYYSAEEIAARVDEYAYSSVMDYKGYNEDAHGIGRYDYAFVAHNYLGMVQAFRRVASMDDGLQFAFNTSGNGQTTPMNLKSWPTIHGLHYTQIPQIFGTRADGTPDIGDDNRYPVFLDETQLVALPGWGLEQGTFSNVTADRHLLVPYRFDTDERAGLEWLDQRYDAGADAFESLHYVASHFLDYYFMGSFARYRTNFSVQSYNGRQWGSYIEQLRQTTQLLAFDLIERGTGLGALPSWNAFVNDPNERGGVVNQAAMNLSADTFVAQLLMPEVGVHHAAAQPDSTRLITPNLQTAEGFDVPVNSGRFFESAWNQGAGFWWLEQLQRVGSFYDKTNALEAMTDPELALLGRDTPTDIRLYQLNFYTMFPEQMIRLFGGLLSEDYQDFAPIVAMSAAPDGSHAITRTHLATLNLPAGPLDGAHNGRVLDAAHMPLDPQTHFTTEEWSAVYTAALFPATFDQTYMNYARLWTDGSPEAVTVANPATQTVAFTDPWSGITYRAMHYGATSGTGALVGASATMHPALGAASDETGIAARMLLHAQDLEAQRQAALASGMPAQAAQMQTAEQQYIQLLSVMHLVTRWDNGGTVALH